MAHSERLEELAALQVLQLVPKLIGTTQQRDVAGVLRIGQPDDAVHAVRGTVGMEDVELLHPQYPPPATGQSEGAGAAHPAQPEALFEDVSSRDDIARLQLTDPPAYLL